MAPLTKSWRKIDESNAERDAIMAEAQEAEVPEVLGPDGERRVTDPDSFDSWLNEEGIK